MIYWLNNKAYNSMKIISFWWKSKKCNEKFEDSNFSIYFYSHLWWKFGVHTNGAVKGVDKNYNWSFWILGLRFDYVNFNYNK